MNYSLFGPPKDAVIKAGSIILTCKPYAYTLNSKFAQTHCDTCFKGERKNDNGGDGGANLSRCGSCQLVRYCDRDCQRIGWGDGHKWECKGFQTHKQIAAPFCRLLLRVIVKLNSPKDIYDIVPPKTRRRFKDLVTHYSDVKVDQHCKEVIEGMVKVVESMLVYHPDIKIPNGAEIVAICGRLFVNTFCILDYEGFTLGTGFYLGASIFDHSCEPMAIANFEKTTIQIRNIRDIPATLPITKITICYKDVLRPCAYRMAELKHTYYFDCACERCSVKMYDLEMGLVRCPNQQGKCTGEVNVRLQDKCPACNQEFNEEFKELILDGEDMAQKKIDEMATIVCLDIAEACCRILKKLNFCDTHWLLLNMVINSFDACVELKLWERAYDYGTLAIKGYRKYLHEHHPTLGFAVIKMAKLCWFLEKEEEAKKYLVEAKKIFQVTHGLDHPFVQESILPLVKEMAMYSGCNGFVNGTNAMHINGISNGVAHGTAGPGTSNGNV